MPRDRIAGVTHVGTRAHEKLLSAMFELMRGDHANAAPAELASLARDRDLNLWRASGVFLEGWATAAAGAIGSRRENCAAAQSSSANRTC